VRLSAASVRWVFAIPLIQVRNLRTDKLRNPDRTWKSVSHSCSIRSNAKRAIRLCNCFVKPPCVTLSEAICHLKRCCAKVKGETVDSCGGGQHDLGLVYQAIRNYSRVGSRHKGHCWGGIRGQTELAPLFSPSTAQGIGSLPLVPAYPPALSPRIISDSRRAQRIGSSRSPKRLTNRAG